MIKSKKTILFDEGEETFFNFMLFGISCHLKDYRLAWGINLAFDIALEKKEPSLTAKDGKNESSHSRFSFISDFGNQFDLVKNRTTTYFAKELPHADFFLKISADELNSSEVKEKLKSTKGVLAAFEIDINELKSKNNFIFD